MADNNFVEELLDRLSSLKVTKKYSYDNSTYTTNVINKDDMPLVKTEVINWYDECFGMELGKKIGTLEAKVKAYESIIANSNFAMAVIKEEVDTDGSEPDKRDS